MISNSIDKYYLEIGMNNLKLLRNTYEEFILKTFKQKFENDQRYSSKNDNYNFYDLIYFITVSYQKYSISNYNSPQNILHTINSEFKNIHKHISGRIVPGSYVRNYFFQPFSILFVDVSGTRNNHYKIERHRIENPHHHGLLLLDPHTKKKWDEINHPNYWKDYSRKSHLVSQIHIEELDDYEDVKRTLNYSTKHASRYINNVQYGDEMLLISPDIEKDKFNRMIFGNTKNTNSNYML